MKFDIELTDGTKCAADFPSKRDAAEFYEIFYGVGVKRIGRRTAPAAVKDGRRK